MSPEIFLTLAALVTTIFAGSIITCGDCDKATSSDCYAAFALIPTSRTVSGNDNTYWTSGAARKTAPIPQVMSDASSPEEVAVVVAAGTFDSLLSILTVANIVSLVFLYCVHTITKLTKRGWDDIAENNRREMERIRVEEFRSVKGEPFCVHLRAVFCPAFYKSPWKTKTHVLLPTSGGESSGTEDEAEVGLAPVALFPMAFLPRLCSSRGTSVVVDADSLRTFFVASLTVVKEEEEEEEEEEEAKMKDE
ncbi:hypothetical protein ASPACDRAFT_48033 [Aspergillus aculeatus ATCC 16872]|uniref:Uncharacterized protein n=1 Tax=Aspergillus aculeatus (strain ATCC 16872 / CBS 172.66 / WB 5094) TaxID=690307 RepID=A0A1L9WGQ9_ASPA1|nr:uncharacterized protein ASPACDRAFT_48033 [Aspergillus aculeatus ATCC 16872]OJJ95287.1 hypothetical protein ASPACDRAFT_48033 [Aspergillus aculeatus ATCC 16872]